MCFDVSAWDDEGRRTPSNQILVTTIRVVEAGAHEQLTVWSRGGQAGTLLVNKGDGVPLAERLTHPWLVRLPAIKAALLEASTGFDYAVNELHELAETCHDNETKTAILELAGLMGDKSCVMLKHSREAEGAR